MCAGHHNAWPPAYCSFFRPRFNKMHSRRFQSGILSVGTMTEARKGTPDLRSSTTCALFDHNTESSSRLLRRKSRIKNPWSNSWHEMIGAALLILDSVPPLVTPGCSQNNRAPITMRQRRLRFEIRCLFSESPAHALHLAFTCRAPTRPRYRTTENGGSPKMSARARNTDRSTRRTSLRDRESSWLFDALQDASTRA